ncbi:MAG: hypothetical protein M3Y57_04265 [Acidobacteriota bacterium]|nr:hypothetical protein [Acidobacteriota bacterium]
MPTPSDRRGLAPLVKPLLRLLLALSHLPPRCREECWSIHFIEIVGCEWFPKGDCYAYLLAHPRRLKRKLKPVNHPQPIWSIRFEGRLLSDQNKICLFTYSEAP